MYLKTQGLVLRQVEYGEHDVLLTILTPSHGRLTAKVRGLRRKNSPFTATCQLLALSEFTLFHHKGKYTVNEAVSVELFHRLRQNLTGLSLGAYFAQAAEVLSQEDMPSPELLQLVLNCLHALTRLHKPEAQVKAVFELRLMVLAGFAPDLSGCASCGSADPDRFYLSEGILACSACGPMEAPWAPVSQGVLEAMRYIASCPSKRIFSFTLSEGGYAQLGRVTEAYLLTQLDRGFSTLDFYKQLEKPT